jgi:hypothetical protein
VADEQRRHVTDPKVLGVLAHPVRLALLNHLVAFGSRTASQCAEAVGATPSACSYHLRQLARFDLVEPVSGDDGRERPWRASAPGYSFQAEPGDAAGMALERNLAAIQLDQDAELARDFLLRVDQLEPRWQQASDYSRFALLLSVSELTELMGTLTELVRPYRSMVRTDPPPDAKRVHLDWRAFPEVGE